MTVWVQESNWTDHWETFISVLCSSTLQILSALAWGWGSCIFTAINTSSVGQHDLAWSVKLTISSLFFFFTECISHLQVDICMELCYTAILYMYIWKYEYMYKNKPEVDFGFLLRSATPNMLKHKFWFMLDSCFLHIFISVVMFDSSAPIFWYIFLQQQF